MTKSEKMQFDMLAHCATGFVAQDIILGKNVRDGSGNKDELGVLLRKDRGYPLNELCVLAGEKGTGKTTKILNDIGAILKIYPVHKIIFFDSDGAYKKDRIRYTTGLEYDDIDRIVEVITPADNITVELVNETLSKANKDYFKTATEVDFFDPVDGRTKKMMPILIYVVDSLSSLNIESFTMAEANDTNNIMSMQRWGKIANHLERALAFLKTSDPKKKNGNFLAFYVAHREDATSTTGAPVKENKTGKTNKKNHIPRRLKQLASTILEMTPTSVPQNPDSPNRIENVLGLEGISTLCYETVVDVGKTRTGNDGDSRYSLVFTESKYNDYLSNVLTCLREGIFVKASGMHPAKDADFEGNPLKLRSGSKQALTMYGYGRVFSITEASRFGSYLANLTERQKSKMSEEEIEKYFKIGIMAWEFNIAMAKAINKHFEYELEANSISNEEMTTAEEILARAYSELY